MTTIRKAEDADFEGIWRIFRHVVQQGDTYTFAPETTKEQAHAIWMSSENATYVALIEEQIVGTYILRRNHVGQGSHVANCGYMVSQEARGKGIGRSMCEHSMEEARKMGFHAMQFNIVVSTNAPAVALWKKCGFSIVGTLPRAYRHKELGLVDAYVMYRFLSST